MRSWGIKAGLATLVLAACPVSATPPRTLAIEDRLFARNADTLFLLRRSVDNHGLHGVAQTDTLMIFRSLDGGDDRGFRAVARVVDSGPGSSPRAETLPLAAPLNPYSVYGDFEAWPLDRPMRWNPEDVTLDDTGLSLAGHDARYVLPLAGVAARIEDTLSASQQLLPAHRIGGGRIGSHPFDPAGFDILADCAPSSALPLNDLPEDPALVELTCADEDGLARAVLWLVVPRA